MQQADLEPLPLATRLRRFAAVARMVVTIYGGYKVRQVWGAITGASRRPDFYDAWNTRSAELARDTALDLEGLLIKACQFAGSRADILPPQFIDILAELQDRVPPRPFAQIGPWLESQLGRPLQECFAHIEETPVASASLAQVHRGRLHDGSDVAIKIQYPDIERLIATDLENFAFFIRLLARIERTFDFRILLDELNKYVPLELDFVNEAANARRFAADFAGDDTVRFPKPVSELCRRTVLTMDYIEGVKITDLDGLARIGVDKHAVAELLARTYIRQILVYGFFHGDPHPGNLLVQKSKRGPVLVILDLGLAKDFTPELRDGLIRLTSAIIAQDAAAIGEAFRQLGFRTRSGNDDTFVTLAELFLGQALRAGRAYADIAMVERINDELMRALRANPIVRASSDLLLVLRVMGLLSGIGKTLDSKVDPLAAMMPFLGMSFAPLGGQK
ncbi:MAG TPA: AarF/ABC1/UbiB kinase family protein [Candidatus Binatia bacterium]|nr:AarF/ABC1/UbiB kinase family protein [Candidatus Binatia bacterium]